MPPPPTPAVTASERLIRPASGRDGEAAPTSAVGPRTAYILHWFPVPTETFVFGEVVGLRRLGLPLCVYTLYGERRRNLSRAMREAADRDVERLGLAGIARIAAAIFHWHRRRPRLTRHLLASALRRRGDGFEKGAENVWAFLAAFALARRFEAAGIAHIHASWANGPATAAWAAARLTGIPFTFTARAWDIYPPDGIIADKIAAAVFVRSETAANIRHLVAHAGGDAAKFRLTHNGVPLAPVRLAEAAMRPPYRLLAVGRFVRKKGFDQLLRALRLLTDAGLDCRLTLAGDGPERGRLHRLARRLRIAERVAFTGFVPHDSVGELFLASDIFVMPCVVAPSGDRDGIPTVIMEALQYRLPVVATAVSGIPELIEDGVTGMLVPERDPTALAAAIRRLTADRDAALALAERGRAAVRQRFDPDTNHRQVFDLYRTVAAPL